MCASRIQIHSKAQHEREENESKNRKSIFSIGTSSGMIEIHVQPLSIMTKSINKYLFSFFSLFPLNFFTNLPSPRCDLCVAADLEASDKDKQKAFLFFFNFVSFGLFNQHQNYDAARYLYSRVYLINISICFFAILSMKLFFFPVIHFRQRHLVCQNFMILRNYTVYAHIISRYIHYFKN